MTEWFSNFRSVYQTWWDDLCQRFEETESFVWCERDNLEPVADLTKVEHEFGALPDELRAFLQLVGVGKFYFPNPGEDEPSELHVFDLPEALVRAESIRNHALREIEQFDEWGCEVHDDAGCGCRDFLVELAAHSKRFYPLLGPDHVHDFIYVVVSGEKRGVVDCWYHDYPAIELLDGSGEFESLAAFGQDFLDGATSGQHPI